jgi:hypothetical protein
MPTTEPDLTPEERFREVAAILAAGILRLRTDRKPTEESPESSGISLDGGSPRLPHVLGSPKGGVWSPEDNGCPGTPPDSGLKTPGS